MLFNVIGPGNEVKVFKPGDGDKGAVWPGTILACDRACSQDHAKVFGSWFCGLGVKVHSGALICPPDAVINPNQ